MDLVFAEEIVTLDEAYYVAEFVSPKQDQRIEARDNAFAGEPEASGAIDSPIEPFVLFDNLSPLDDIDDPDFEAFLELIKD